MVEEGFHLVTAPARVSAPGAPVHGDGGFWVGGGGGRREDGWRGQRGGNGRWEGRERREREWGERSQGGRGECERTSVRELR